MIPQEKGGFVMTTKKYVVTDKQMLVFIKRIHELETRLYKKSLNPQYILNGLQFLIEGSKTKAFSNVILIQRELNKLQGVERELLDKQRGAIQRAVIRCTKCDKGSKLSSWVFIQDVFWVLPYSCNGGGYWKDSETFLCHIRCPKCDAENYICTHPQKDKIVDLTKNYSCNINELFKTVEKSKRY